MSHYLVDDFVYVPSQATSRRVSNLKGLSFSSDTPGWNSKMEAASKDKLFKIKTVSINMYNGETKYQVETDQGTWWYLESWLLAVNKTAKVPVSKHSHVIKKIAQLQAKRKAKGYAF